MNYIIVDLDDTILTKDKKISDNTISYFNYLKKHNYLIVFNTARSYSKTKEYIDIINPDFSILNGGAIIYDINQNIIYNKTINKDITNKIINLIKQDNNILNFSIEADNGLYSPDKSYCDKFPLTYYEDFNNYFDHKSYKILISSYDKEKWQSIAKSFNLFYEQYYDGKWFRISSSNKYLGNLALFNYLNDQNPHDYTFGDDIGDIEMINKSYHGVLLNNSYDEYKKLCKNITKDDAENDGVINYLKEVLVI